MHNPMGTKGLANDAFQLIYEEAKAAARNAILANSHLENPNAFDCGFAWVQVTPGTHPFVRWARKRGVGHKHWSHGWEFWKPGCREANFGGQSVGVIETGAQAFAEVLKRHLLSTGLTVQVGTRLD